MKSKEYLKRLMEESEMKDKKKSVIYFPHTIGGNMLDRLYTFNDINGGMKKPADLGLDPFNYLGGNVEQLGYMEKMGFYACPSRWDQTILGFFVHDGAMVTKEGRKILDERLGKEYPGWKIEYGAYAPEPAEVSHDELLKRQKLKEEYIAMGGLGAYVSHGTAAELKAMIDAMKSGKMEKVAAVQEQAEVAPLAPDTVKVNRPRSTGKAPASVARKLKKHLTEEQ